MCKNKKKTIVSDFDKKVEYTLGGGGGGERRRRHFHIRLVGGVPTFSVSIFSKNFRKGIPKACNLPEHVKLIL